MFSEPKAREESTATPDVEDRLMTKKVVDELAEVLNNAGFAFKGWCPLDPMTLEGEFESENGNQKITRVFNKDAQDLKFRNATLYVYRE